MAKDSIDKMKGVRGKMITQGGHGYLHAFWDSEKRFPDFARAYRESSHAYKITLIVPTTVDLFPLMHAYHPICGVSMVQDAGFTVFTEPTVTCLGIGPIPEHLIGDDLKALKTFT
jgi:peptidyl-tRNA hydrolase